LMLPGNGKWAGLCAPMVMFDASKLAWVYNGSHFMIDQSELVDGYVRHGTTPVLHPFDSFAWVTGQSRDDTVSMQDIRPPAGVPLFAYDRRRTYEWHPPPPGELGALAIDAATSVFVQRVLWCESVLRRTLDPRVQYFGGIYLGAHARCLARRIKQPSSVCDPRDCARFTDDVWGALCRPRFMDRFLNGRTPTLPPASEPPLGAAPRAHRTLSDVLRVFVGTKQSGKNSPTVRDRALACLLQNDVALALRYYGVCDSAVSDLRGLCMVDTPDRLKKAVMSLRQRLKGPQIEAIYRTRAWDEGPRLEALSGNHREAHLAAVQRLRRARTMYSFCPVCFTVDLKHPCVTHKTKLHNVSMKRNRRECGKCAEVVPVVTFSIVGAVYAHGQTRLAACTTCLQPDLVCPEAFLPSGLFLCASCRT
jgi:hypothetical protein